MSCKHCISMLLRILFVFLISLSGLFMSCKHSQSKLDPPVARVYKQYLYQSDIKAIIPSGLNEKDSIELALMYIHQWIDNALIVREANKKLNTLEKDFSEKIRNYRNNLLMFEWEKKILAEELDTLVTASEIQLYYNENQHEFVLQADIIRALYIKLNANSPFTNTASALINSVPPNISELEQFCKSYSVNYFLDTQSWLYYDELAKEIPLTSAQKNELVRGNTYVYLEDEEYKYFLRSIDFQMKGTVSPLALETESIKKILLQKRKNDNIRAKKLELRRQAEQKMNIQIYK